MTQNKNNCLRASTTNLNEAVTVANNRAQYYADLAKQYRDEAKEHRDNAKQYAEKNSDVTLEYVETMRATLDRKIDNCVFQNDLPKVSEFENDAEYVNTYELNSSIDNKILVEGQRIDAQLSAKLGKQQITNCILETPQRIKYTLENGTLTIKAGSVVIYPFGIEDLTADYPKGATFLNDNFKVYDTQFEDGKFFVWAELVSDCTGYRETTDSYQRVISVYMNDNVEAATTAGSGTSAPSDSRIFYNTVTNKITYFTNGVDGSIISSFPIGYCKANGSTVFGSISNWFDGIGCIGSTIWADKGIKVLCPNGRNEDGTLNNIEEVSAKLATRTFSNGWTADYTLLFEGTNFSVTTQEYSDIFNINQYAGAMVATLRLDNDLISNFKPKYAFQAVDYNDFKVLNTNALLKSDKSTIAGWSMPSQKTYTFTKGASGTTYTMPADGWLYVKATGSASVDKGKWLYIGNQTSGISMQEATNFDIPQESIMPVREKDVVVITWGNLTLNTVKLYYLQGGN